MTRDGLYISHGPDRHALVVIRQEDGRVFWVRDFASIGSAIDVVEDDVLSNHNRADILASVSGNKGFFTADVVEPEDGFFGCSFKRYTLSKG